MNTENKGCTEDFTLSTPLTAPLMQHELTTLKNMIRVWMFSSGRASM
jgi:hypothetical protein